jgi:hypothetical protein
MVALTVLLDGVEQRPSPRITDIIALLLLKQGEIDAIRSGSVEIRFDRSHVHRSLILGSVVNVDRDPPRRDQDEVTVLK